MNPTATIRGPRAVETRSLPEYAPTPHTDFGRPESRVAFERALAEVRSQLGREHPLMIGGRRLEAETTFASINPARPAEVIGRFQSASREQAAQAIAAAADAFRSWSRVPAY